MEPTHFQIYALSHVKSNRKKSCSSRKNLTQNRSPKEGQDGVRHENEKEIDRRNGQTLLHGKQEAQDENHRRVHRNHRLQPKIRHSHPQKYYEKYYGQDVQKEVIHVWIFSMYLCAKRLVPFIRDNIDYLALKFSYTEQLKTKLAHISSATVGRMLKPEIPKHSIRGIATTRPAKNLNKLIPIRTFFDWDERKRALQALAFSKPIRSLIAVQLPKDSTFVP